MAKQDDCAHTTHQVDAEHFVAEFETLRLKLKALDTIERGLHQVLAGLQEWQRLLEAESKEICQTTT